MHDRLRQINDEYETLEAQLSDPEVLADPDQLRTLSKRYTELGPVVETFRRREARAADAEAARSMLPDAVGDERDLLVEEIDTVNEELVAIDDELRELMVPPDPYAGKNVIVEIRGAEGGEEANLFARDLFEMYRAYAGRHGLKVEHAVASTVSDLGGVQRGHVRRSRATPPGRDFKYEGGPHRVQRVPVTESQGRIHTSSATVIVLPEADEVDVQIDDRRPPDRRVPLQRCRAARASTRPTRRCASRTCRPGSWCRCRTSAASCRTGRGRWRCCGPACSSWPSRSATPSCRSSGAPRSAAAGGARRSAPTTSRRTGVTDHRIGFTVYRLADVLAGDLDDVVAALAADERARQLADADDLTVDAP